jgi:hypothetical protein
MTKKSYYVSGFRHDDTSAKVNMIVDAGSMENKTAIAEAIAGPEYMFHMSMNISGVVPETAKNRLLTEAELYAAAPEFDLRARKRKTRRTKQGTRSASCLD